MDKGKYSRSPIERIFGSWQKMKKELGIELSRDILHDRHDEVIEKYNQGKSTLDIGEEYNVNDETIRNILKDNNVERRGVHEIRRIPLDESVFEKPLGYKESWLFGLIVADGCIYKHNGGHYLSLEFTQDDEELIDHSVEILDYNGSRYYRDKMDSVSITLGSKKIFNDLKSFGLVENKTYNQSHLNLADVSKPDFLRGFFEGDGSVSVSNNVIYVQMTGHKELIYQISEVIENQVDINTSLFERSRKDKWRETWICSFGGNKIVDEFYQYVYNDCKFYLNRKKQVFEGYFS